MKASSLILLAAATVATAHTGGLGPPVRVGDLWGVNVHFTSRTILPGELAMLFKAFRIVRTGINWKFFESRCGTYDFGPTHALASMLRAAGLRIMISLGSGNDACYPGSRPGACDTPACISGYANFTAAVVAHFKGVGILWEAPNEPNLANQGDLNATAYAAIVAAAAPAFAHSGEALLGPAVSELNPASFAYLRDVFAAGILRDVDAVTVHPYRSGGPESALQDWATLRALVDAATPANRSSARIPLAAGEWGWTTAGGACGYACRASEADQGKYVVRSWLANSLVNVSLNIDYDWRSDGASAEDCESNFGAVRFAANGTGNASQPFVPKPVYVAAAALQAALGGAAAAAGRVPATPSSGGGGGGNATAEDLFVAAFVGGDAGAGAFAVWTNVSSSSTSTAAAAADAATAVTFATTSPATPGVPPDACFAVVDWLGQPLPSVCAAGGMLTVNATDAPIYLVVSSSSSS